MPIIPQKQFSIIILCLSCCCWFLCLIRAADDIGSNMIFEGQRLRDGEFLKSGNKLFTLQFFSLKTSTDRYLGIFLQTLEPEDDNKPVWVANRDNPIKDNSSILTINPFYCRLSIIYRGGNVLFPATSAAPRESTNTSATLQDDGNLVLKEVYSNGSSSDVILWQSFDYPTDTLLPGMKLGLDFKTGRQRSLTSWASDQAPLSGSFTLGARRNASQLSIWWHDKVFWTIDDWKSSTAVYDGHLGIVTMYVSSEKEKYFTYSLPSNVSYRWVRLTPDGKIVLKPLNINLSSCDPYSSMLLPSQAGCANYSFPKCMNGNGNSYNFSNRSYGSNYSSSILEEPSILSLADCKAKCVQNCSCDGYASLHENGTGCRFWDSDAVKFMEPSFGTGGSLVYIRDAIAVAEANLKTMDTKRGRRWKWQWLIGSIGGALLLLLSIFCIKRKSMAKAKRKKAGTLNLRKFADTSALHRNPLSVEEMFKRKNEKIGNVLQFEFETIEMATNMFSMENKLGEGGFGPVYKGTLLDGQEIAVKRLSRS